MQIKMNITDILIISGKRNSGKTNLCRYLLNQIEKNYDILVYDINNDYDDYKQHHFNDVVEYINFFNKNTDIKKNTFYVFDDVDLIMNSYSIPNFLMNFIYIGRHKNTGGIFIFRRLNNIHKQLMFNADYMFIAKTGLSNDIEYIKKNINEWELISKLDQYQFLMHNLLTDEYQIIKVPVQQKKKKGFIKSIKDVIF